jgi:hypothetical protein
VPVSDGDLSEKLGEVAFILSVKPSNGIPAMPEIVNNSLRGRPRLSLAALSIPARSPFSVIVSL